MVDLLGAMDVDPCDVRAIKIERGIGLMEAKRIAKADKLMLELVNMRYSLGEYDVMTIEEKFERLLDMFIVAVGKANG